MGTNLTKKFFESETLNTKIKSANVSFTEIVLGYFLGPVGGLLTSQVFVVYLNTYWTDVLNLSGGSASRFLSLFPLISILFIVIGNLVSGILIDKTITRQGRARPFLFIAAPLIAIACIAMFAVPDGSEILQMIWIAVSYNLFYSVAYPLYNTANQTMLPLSTRNGKQRGKISVLNGMSLVVASSFASMVLPMIVPLFGVDRYIWLGAMCIFGGISLIAVLIQYYFTRERVTEENIKLNIRAEKIPVLKQLKAVAAVKDWWLVILFFVFFLLSGNMQNFSMTYYCNYVLGSYSDGYTQTVLGVVTGIPLGLGMLFSWPLAKKIGKKNSIFIGLIISAAGCFMAMLFPESWIFVGIGLFLKCLGAAPANYVMMALFADVLDHIEAKYGFRCDGFSMSLRSIMMATALSICQGIFNWLISASGYVAPGSEIFSGNEVVKVLKDGTYVFAQNEATKSIFIWCYIGVMMIGYIICAVLICSVNVEKTIDKDHEIIKERQKQKVLEAGGVWIEPEERMRQEQEEYDRKAEEARIKELKILCEKKGMDFDKAEAEYQKRKNGRKKEVKRSK